MKFGKRHGLSAVAAVAGVFALAFSGAASGAPDAAAQAREILGATGVKGGLVVHLGCGDGVLTAALRPSERYVVQGLDRDPAKVAAARQYIRSKGLYGPVSVDRLGSDRLPYADNLVNLVVAEDMSGVGMPEVLRVLAPDGVAYAKNGNDWTKTVKPRPDGADEWTHFLHDASGNPVANDQLVGPPRRLQWREGPTYVVSHEHTPGIAALVSSGGRIFYVADEASISSILEPADWHVVARDAYNGVRLWQRPVSAWWPRVCIWTAGPRQLQRRLVAVNDRVYATLGYYDPVSALDAATGETVRIYEETRGAEEILWHKGVLLVVTRNVTEQRTAEIEKWSKLGQEKDSPLRVRETMDPMLKQLREIENKTPISILALDADTGQVLWKKEKTESNGLAPLTLCAVGERVFCQKGGDIRCFDLKTGVQAWSVPAPGTRLRTACDQAIVCAGAKAVTALAPATGATLWTQQPLLCDIKDAFVIGDSLWLGGFKPFDTGKGKHTGPVWGPYFATQHDLATGALRQQIDPENPGHHHRCYQNKATSRYLLGGRRGTEFIDLQTGEVSWNSWARGVCSYGVMPCNGLLYVPPHECGCYSTTKLVGFNALATATPQSVRPDAAEANVAAEPETGPASAAASAAVPTAPGAQDWPSYRHDAERSGATPVAIPAAVTRAWQHGIGGRITAPVVAGDKVLVASVEDHRVVALDAASGAVVWEFTAGARVDSPPTVRGDRALFGCRDGYVYSVRLADGALAWRLRAAREERRVAVDSQLEAASPLFGSVLLRGDAAYVTAGRSSYLDGGIDLCRINPDTGRLLARAPIYSPDPETGKAPPQYNGNSMPGARADVLSADAQHVYLRDLVFDADGKSVTEGEAHLFAVTGFLDDAWTHRSYLIFGKQNSLATGCSGRAKDLIYGRFLVFDAARICGYGRKAVHWSNQLEDGPYHLFAVNRADGARQWSQSVPVSVRAMVMAENVLFAAGTPGDELAPPTGTEGKRGGLLLALSTTDGTELARCDLDSPPAFDGMAAAYGRLYVTTTDGKVLCLAGK